ncbi:MAG: helix-turn-helix domain-containing protein [Gaiellaceae bacterium]
MQATRNTEPSHFEELLQLLRERRQLPPADERRRIREAADVSQRELARALGVSWTAIQRWEDGARPRNHTVQYAEALAELRRFAGKGSPLAD